MDFIKYLEEEYQEKVANGYKKDFLQFMYFLNDRQQKPTEVKKSDITEYIMWLREEGAKETTINKKISLIRKFYKYLRIQRSMLENPFEEIKQLKIYKEDKEITDEQKDNLIQKADSERDRLILKLLIKEKVKPTEMINLKFENIDDKKGMVFIENKAVILSEDTLKTIGDFDGISEQYILTNQHGKQIKESGIYFILNKYLKDSNIKIKPNELLRSRERKQ